jgi:hypothetical protein
MMAGTRTGFLGIVGTVFGKIENRYVSIPAHYYPYAHFTCPCSRRYDVTFMYIFYGGMQTGESVVAGTQSEKLCLFLCFDENTIMKLGSGDSVYIKHLNLEYP